MPTYCAGTPAVKASCPYIRIWLWLLSGVLLAAVVCSAVEVLPEELADRRAWTAAKFEGTARSGVRIGEVQVIANHDPVQRNSRNGRPMRMGTNEYTRGLYCHAPSHLVVRLPSAALEFTAVVGVDSNEQTSGGRGSVDFSVRVGDSERFRSGVMREGAPSQFVRVPLDGAAEFIMRVEPTADGIACDQADWANAKVKLQDGRELWLAGLPLRSGTNDLFGSTELPFSFSVGGVSSRKFLKDWPLKRSSRELDAARTEHTLTWQDPASKFNVRCVAVEYRDFPTVEWTLYFKNTGSGESPLLSDVLALDTPLRAGGPATLRHHKGTFVRADDFEPLTTVLEANKPLRFAPPGGRPLGHVFPYFNVEGQGEGTIAVVGWPGQWFAEFTQDAAQGVQMRAGQESLRCRLKPGEEIRTPLAVLQFWRGDWIGAQNVWRRWMLAHNVPKPGGKPLGPQMAACSSHQYAEMINANEQNQMMFVDRYLEEKLPLDYWWMDAGWYVHHGGGWPRTGTWEVDTARFPRGLRSISDHARAKGVKTIVWFEPERVTPGTFLYTNNPAWLLGKDGDQKLLNLGAPEPWHWLVEHVSKLIREQGIDLYRQDYNIDPLGFWRGADAEDRQGVTENHYVTGYLAYWDELLKRFPNLLIDTCASGGHRNDLETLRRSVPLLRSDYILEPIGQQAHTFGLAFWIPFFGTGITALDDYTFRSQMCPHLIACYDMRRTDLPWDSGRRLLKQWKEDIAPNYFGDFYPLSKYSTADDTWIAWQYDRPESGTGVVQVFCRPSSIYESARFKLRGLKPGATYLVTDVDGVLPQKEMPGRELQERGLLVTAPQSPSAIVLTYRLQH